MRGAPAWRNYTCCGWWRPARTWKRISSPSRRPSSKNTPPKSPARNKPRAPRTKPPSPVPDTTLFHFRDRTHQSQVAAILRRLPPVEGAPLVIESARGLRSRGHAVHAASFLRERRIVFDCTRSEFPRIFVIGLQLADNLTKEQLAGLLARKLTEMAAKTDVRNNN